MLAELATTGGAEVRTAAELVRDVPGARIRRGADASVRRVRIDSRAVEPGDVFVALPGRNVDGARFLQDAVARGAAAVVTAPDVIVPPEVAWITADDPRRAAAHLSAAAWGHPARSLDVIGFTGTNGKTTSSFLARAALEGAGRRVAVVGTLGAYLPDGHRPHARTTPEAPDVQATLAEALEQGCDTVVMEVSSHALDLSRVDGIGFAAAAFLNLSPEHLDWHGTMEAYGHSKLRLFSELLAPGRTKADRPRAALHGKDPWAARFRQVVDDAILFAVGDDEAAEVGARGLRIDPDGTRFDLLTPDGTAAVTLTLPGRHNVENALAAASLGWLLGADAAELARGLSSGAAPPGRFERIHSGRFDVYVDYAHTEDGLERALDVARRITRGRLIVVLGCGGDRDRKKRPGMGRLAAAGADLALFTSDNPRGEDPAAIAAEMLTGVEDRDRVDVILDREEALARAIELAKPGDVVLATGKGHETYQEIDGVKHPFPEREILARLANDRDGAA